MKTPTILWFIGWRIHAKALFCRQR